MRRAAAVVIAATGALGLSLSSNQALASPDQKPTTPPPADKPTWWKRLKAGLSRSSSSIGQGIADVFTKRKLDAAALEDLEDILVRADLGVAASTRIYLGALRKKLEADPSAPRYIQTVWGVGYVFVPDGVG